MLKELEQVKKEKKELEAKVKPGKDNTKGMFCYFACPILLRGILCTVFIES